MYFDSLDLLEFYSTTRTSQLICINFLKHFSSTVKTDRGFTFLTVIVSAVNNLSADYAWFI